MACRIFVLCPGIQPGLSAVKAWSPNHWTAREFPQFSGFIVGVLHVGLKPFTSQVKVLCPHLVAGCRSRGGLYGKVASQPLSPTLV